MDAKLAAQRAEFSNSIDLMQVQNNANLKELTNAIGNLNNQAPPKTWVDQMLEQIPGLKDRFQRLFEPPAPSTDSGIRITLPEAKDSEGNPIGVDLDSYERLENLRMKKDALGFARQQMPAFFATAQRMAKSWDRMAAQGEVGQDQDTAETDCPECGLHLTYKKGAEAFQCPQCKAIQTPDGQIVTPGKGKGAKEKPTERGASE